MKSIPDVLGYKLEDALLVLNSNFYDVIIKETISKKSNKEGEARVVQLRSSTENKVEIIISYF